VEECAELVEHLVDLTIAVKPSDDPARAALLKEHRRILKDTAGSRLAAACTTWPSDNLDCARAATNRVELAACNAGSSMEISP
jgi:hypothetical protein